MSLFDRRWTNSTASTLVCLLVVASRAVGSDAPVSTRIASPGGEIAIVTAAERAAYDEWKFAPVRRAGDFVYVSGVVIRRDADGPRTPETFKVAARRAFATIRARLGALGADFADVVMIHSFHDWSAPEFQGDREAQFAAFRGVKDEFMSAPFPAWTAVGTSGLIREGGIVEVEMIAYSPGHQHVQSREDRGAASGPEAASAPDK